MHNSIMNFLKKIPPAEICGKYVIEFGALNINGSAREILEPMKPRLYEGYDLIAGPGVDRVVDFSSHARNMDEAENPDVIVCLNTLEHSKNWGQVIRNIKHLLKRGRLLIFSVPSKGFPWHNPPDYWRFSKEQISGIFSDMNISYLEKDPEIEGVIMLARAVAMTGTVPLFEYKPEAVLVPEIADIFKYSAISWDEL